MSTHFYHGCHFLHFHCSKYRSWCLFHLVPQRHCSPALEKKKKKNVESSCEDAAAAGGTCPSRDSTRRPHNPCAPSRHGLGCPHYHSKPQDLPAAAGLERWPAGVQTSMTRPPRPDLHNRTSTTTTIPSPQPPARPQHPSFSQTLPKGMDRRR